MQVQDFGKTLSFKVQILLAGGVLSKEPLPFERHVIVIKVHKRILNRTSGNQKFILKHTFSSSLKVLHNKLGFLICQITLMHQGSVRWRGLVEVGLDKITAIFRTCCR